MCKVTLQIILLGLACFVDVSIAEANVSFFKPKLINNPIFLGNINNRIKQLPNIAKELLITPFLAKVSGKQDSQNILPIDTPVISQPTALLDSNIMALSNPYINIEDNLLNDYTSTPSDLLTETTTETDLWTTTENPDYDEGIQNRISDVSPQVLASLLGG